jgi:hypothetical protein
MPIHLLCSLHMSGDAVHKDTLFCLTIPKHETTQGIFNVLRGYIAENLISWDRTVGFCTDGAPYGEMVGRPLHSSYECVSLCHMDVLHDTPRATGGKRAEHRTLIYTVAGHLDCKLHQTTSTACTSLRKTM